MEIRMIHTNEKQLWQDYIDSNPYAIAWQSYDWSQMLAKHYTCTFLPIAAFENGALRGVLPLYHMKTIKGKSLLLSVPYAVAGGIVADDSSVAHQLLQKAVETSRRYDSCPITLKQYKIKVDGDLLTDENYYNRELDLKKGTDTLWNELDERNRQMIQEAEEKEFRLEFPSDDIESFFRLLLAFNHQDGIPCVSRKWVYSLVQTGMYSCALVKNRGNVVAGTLVKEFKKTVSFPFTCLATQNAAYPQHPAYWMYWNLIKQYVEKGFEIVHSGRIPKSNDAYPFRLGWGGTEYNYYYQYHPNTGRKTEYTAKRGSKREIFKTCWKMLPQSFSEHVGPHIVKQFP